MSGRGYKGACSINILKPWKFYTLLFTLGRPRRESISIVQGNRQKAEALVIQCQLKNNGKKNFYVSEKKSSGSPWVLCNGQQQAMDQPLEVLPKDYFLKVYSGFYLVSNHNHPFIHSINDYF